MRISTSNVAARNNYERELPPGLTTHFTCSDPSENGKRI